MLEEANRIKERLRACKTVQEVEAVANEERKTVMGWNPEGLSQEKMQEALELRFDLGGLMFLHVCRLKEQIINQIERAEQNGS